MTRRKAQASGTQAALLILVITVLIVFYILFLPPEDRADLLSDMETGDGFNPSNVPYPQEGPRDIVLQEYIGLINYVGFNEQEHKLPSFRIDTDVDDAVLATSDSLFVKNSPSQKITGKFTFNADSNTMTNFVLSFNVVETSGVLTITLNGENVYTREVLEGSVGPVVLDDRLIEDYNVLEFSTDSVGWYFWKSNQYTLENLQVAARVTDYSRSEARHSFIISEAEYNTMEEAKITYLPECDVNNVGPLHVIVNDREVFSGIADCGIVNKVDLSTSDLFNGRNDVVFYSDAGYYLIDRPEVVTEVKDDTNPVYYFNLIEDLFVFIDDAEKREELCGLDDNVCPRNCGADEDVDCCFGESSDNFWCDIETDNFDDRCVGLVEEDTCERCPSGYEDKNGNPAEECEELCGDDTDDDCPGGCSIYYDEDCCFEDDDENYWCDSVPLTGLENTCEKDVSVYECDDCTTGYWSEELGRPDCSGERDLDRYYDVLDEELDEQYDIVLTITFVEQGRNKIDLEINGFLLTIDTEDRVYIRNISDLVQSGTNTLEMIPRNDIHVGELKVEVI